jgi:hypothetical protein
LYAGGLRISGASNEYKDKKILTGDRSGFFVFIIQ